MNRSRWLLLAALAVALAGVGWAVGHWLRTPSPVEPLPAQAAAARGPLLYQAHCASCHGPNGHGGGSAIANPPRDFSARPWRFEVSPAAIKRVTLEGIPGTGMPSFRSALSPAEMDALAAYVYQMAAPGGSAEDQQTERARLLQQAGFTTLAADDPPRLTLAVANGKTVQLTDLRGKLVVLHFWGSGCAPSIQEIPQLEALQKEHPARLTVLHICTDEGNAAAAQKVLDRLAPGAIAYADATGLGLARFEVTALPTVWLIDPAGKVVGRAHGARDWQSAALKALIAELLPPKFQ